MAYLRDRAIVLKCEPFREHDVRLTLYGKTYGKLTAVARGSQRLSAKHLGHVEPLSEVEVMIARGATFDKLAVAHLTRPRLHLRSSLAALSLSGALADLIHRLTHPEVLDPGMYHLLEETLDALQGIAVSPSAERMRLLLNGATLKVLDLLGYALDLERCAHCRARLEKSSVLIVGALWCGMCAAAERWREATPLPDHTLPLLRFLRVQPLAEALKVTTPLVVLSTLDQVMREALQHTPLLIEPHGARTVTALLG